MAPSKKCRHDRERVTYCAECEEVLPPRYSTDGIMLSTLQVLKAHGATLDTIKLAVQGQPVGEALVEAVAATPEPDEELITAKEASKIVGLSAEWCRENYLELGGRKMGNGKKPRKMLLKSAVVAYAASQKAPEVLAVEKPKPNGRPWDGPLLAIKGKAPQ